MELCEEELNSNSDDVSELKNIRVVGVGGAGGNAINMMYDLKMEEVTFIACNTDKKTLDRIKADIHIVLGPLLTKGLGAGNEPEVGRKSAIESEDAIRKVLKGAEIVFVSAGMGGGTGSGAAPEVARIAKEEGALVIAVVTIPERSEGYWRLKNVLDSIPKLYKQVDAMLVVNCDMMIDVIDPEWSMMEVRKFIDGVLSRAVQGVSQIVTSQCVVQNDFADLRKAMTNSGICYIGIGSGTGKDRAEIALRSALHSPLLRNQDFRGAQYIMSMVTTSKNRYYNLREHNYIENELGKFSKPISALSQSHKGSLSDLATHMPSDGINPNIPDDSDEMQITIVVTGYKKGIFDYSLVKKGAQESIVIDDNGNFTRVENQSDEEDKYELDIEAQLAQLYGIEKPEEPSKNERLVETYIYSDPVILSDEMLLDEVALYNFEREPAYRRRRIPHLVK